MTKQRFEVCPASELQPGERRIEMLGKFSVGVFNVDGEYYAIKNDCPHQRAPLCKGKLTGTTTSDQPGEYNWERDGQIITCPWHGWEFDVTTGDSVFNPHKVKTKTFETAIETSNAHSDDRVTETNRIDGDDTKECVNCSIKLQGDEPPVETYDTEVEHGIVVVYL
jgi:nitrite reductase/ring-hydroxylating ferredoxin subunit